VAVVDIVLVLVGGGGGAGSSKYERLSLARLGWPAFIGADDLGVVEAEDVLEVLSEQPAVSRRPSTPRAEIWARRVSDSIFMTSVWFRDLD